MVIGIGTDIVNIERIKKLYDKTSEKFVKRILAEEEFKRFNELAEKLKIPYLAKRFAAKEAVAKALGTGISDGLSFTDITISNFPNGKPVIKISEDKFPELSTLTFHISLSDDSPFAVAFVLITR